VVKLTVRLDPCPIEARQTIGLSTFLREASGYFSSLKSTGKDESLDVPLPRVAQTIEMLAEPLAQAQQQGAFLDVWGVAGLKRNEIRTASVLAWLIDPAGSHGAGDDYLRAFWNRAGGHDYFELTGPFRVLTEHSPDGDRGQRVDIVLVGKDQIIFIEVKIDAPQHRLQLERYTEVAKSLGKQFLVIYLSEESEELPNQCKSIRWRDVAAAIRDVIRAKNPQWFSTMIAMQFARHVDALH
jgi:hypothetical protein